MRLNAPRVKNRDGIRGRFVREIDYRAAMNLASVMEEVFAGRLTLDRAAPALAALKCRTVRDYPSLIATREARAAQQVSL